MSKSNVIPFRTRNAHHATTVHAVSVRLVWPRLADFRAALAPAVRFCRMLGTCMRWIAWVFSLPVQAILLLYVGIISILSFIGMTVYVVTFLTLAWLFVDILFDYLARP